MKTVALAAVLSMSALLISEAAACACCTDAGDRFEGSEALSDDTRGELRAIRLAPTAQLYSDAGFPDSVKGLKNPQNGDYRIAWTAAKDRLLLTAIDPSNAFGTIAMLLPRSLHNLAFDPEKGPKLTSGPLLHREWRLDGDATLTGIFAAESTRAKVQVIFQGEGNRCVNASDFKSWSLSLSGPGVAVKLLGKTVEK